MAGQWKRQKFELDGYYDWLVDTMETQAPGKFYAPGGSVDDRRSSADIRTEARLAAKPRAGITLQECEHIVHQTAKSPRQRSTRVAPVQTTPVSPNYLGLLGDHREISKVLRNRAAGQVFDHVIVAPSLPSYATVPHPVEVGTWGSRLRPSRAKALSDAESRTVIMGIVDEGIAFANERFRRSVDDSRVEYAWIQDGYRKGNVPYGRELRKAEIDDLLQDCATAGQVNEDLFYARAGVVDFGRTDHKAVARRIAHGSHVMDLACGYPPGKSPVYRGRDLRPIVCVKLPTVTVAESSGVGLELYMMDAVNYIFDRAEDIAKARNCGSLPVVINFSSGLFAGPHDGRHPIEVDLDDIIRTRRQTVRTEIVLPAGNNNLSRMHAKIGPLDPGEEKTLNWRVLPDCQACSYVEIWLPASLSSSGERGVELRVKPPGGQWSDPLHANPPEGGETLAWQPDGKDTICQIYYQYFGPPTNRGRYLVAVIPTAFEDRIPVAFKNGEPTPQDRPSPLAPAGTWLIQVRNRTRKQIDPFGAWIQWDDRFLGYPRRGRQSYFTDCCYKRFDDAGRPIETDDDPTCIVRREGSMIGIATGTETLVIGGFYRKEKKVVRYSAGGPLESPSGSKGTGYRSGPDAMAVSDDSIVHEGVLAAGTRSGSVAAMNGTSVAAPQVARLIADTWARGCPASGRDIAKGLAKVDLARAPEERRGAGGIETGSTRLPRFWP